MEFKWIDDVEIGYYECELYEGDKKINDISFTDYTSEYHLRVDKERRCARPHSFEVHWCHGWSMSEGFDYDPDYYNHADENGELVGGYQGNCTHTVDYIKRWCENWLAQRYLSSYYHTLAELDKMKERAEWFESQGFKLEDDRVKIIDTSHKAD